MKILLHYFFLEWNTNIWYYFYDITLWISKNMKDKELIIATNSLENTD